MFHLKTITIDTHPTALDIEQEVIAHPVRQYTIEASSFDLPVSHIKELLKKKCGLCIKSNDPFDKATLTAFINIGKERVTFLAKGFEEADLLVHLKKGASVVVSKDDDFDLMQIEKLINEGKERCALIGAKLPEEQLTKFLEKGASLLLKKEDLTPFAISRLIALGQERVNVQSAGFSNFRIDKFLEAKATLTIGEGNKLPRFKVEQKVKKYKQQIQVSSAHVEKKEWLNKLEGLGAVIV